MEIKKFLPKINTNIVQYTALVLYILLAIYCIIFPKGLHAMDITNTVQYFIKGC